MTATSSTSVSADITARYEPFVPAAAEQSRSDAERAGSELQLADDLARKLKGHLERRLASQLNNVS